MPACVKHYLVPLANPVFFLDQKALPHCMCDQAVCKKAGEASTTTMASCSLVVVKNLDDAEGLRIHPILLGLVTQQRKHKKV